MGNRGRFGKYGEIKRYDRLRRAKMTPLLSNRSRLKSSGTRKPLSKSSPKESPVIICAAEDSDNEFITRLSRRVFNVYGPYEEIIPRWFESEIKRTIIACTGGKRAGFAMIGDPFSTYDLYNATEILAIAVDPKSQRRGIGELLLREVDKMALEYDIKRIFLHTAIDNLVAQGLFTRMGYRPWEIKPSFYPKGQDAVVMSKEPEALD